MITLDRVRSAVLSRDPSTELDNLVRAEIAVGRKTADIFDVLLPIARELRKTTPLSEDADQILLGTLDALTGNCNPDECYQDPPNATLPTEEEIAKLPRWARVAFAARCARRVLPLFSQKWPDAPEEHIARLVWAVEVGEKSAASAGRGEDWAPPAGAIVCAAYVCDAIINADRDRRRATEVIMATAVAVSKFKDKAENVLDAHTGAALRVITHNASVAVSNGIATSRETYDAAVVVADMVIRGDFDRLVQLAEEQRWTDDTQVPPEMFGPMWPEGPPKAWPAITASPRTDNPDLFLPSLVQAAV